MCACAPSVKKAYSKVASYQGPLRGGERARYILTAHALLITQNLGDRIFPWIPAAHPRILLRKLDLVYYAIIIFMVAKIWHGERVQALSIVSYVLSSVGGIRDKKERKRKSSEKIAKRRKTCYIVAAPTGTEISTCLYQCVPLSSRWTSKAPSGMLDARCRLASSPELEARCRFVRTARVWGMLAHAQSVCTRPFLLPSKGLDTRLTLRANIVHFLPCNSCIPGAYEPLVELGGSTNYRVLW